jgi:hypothetical protein
MLILCPDWRLRAQDRLAGERSLKGFHGLAPTFTDRQKTGDGLALIARHGAWRSVRGWPEIALVT